MSQLATRGGNTAITLRPVTPASLQSIEQVVADCNMSKLGQVGVFARAIKLAEGVTHLRHLVDDTIMDYVGSLMNTAIGFKTDKDPNRPVWNPDARRKEAPEPYTREIVKDCFIQALLWGALPVGNEFNIIAGNTYLTKEFYMRKVGELPGVTDVKNSPGCPQLITNNEQTSAKIRVAVSWKRDGIADQLLDSEGKPGRVFEIRVNKGMGTDAIIGKAMRKAYHAAFMQIIGSSLTPPEGDAAETIDAEVTSARSTPVEGSRSFAASLPATATAKAIAPPEPPQPETPPVQIQNYQAFRLAVTEWAGANNVDEDALNKSIAAQVIGLGKRGKEDEISPDTLNKWFGQMQAGTWRME